MPNVRRNYGLQWIEPMPRIPTIITNSIIYLYSDQDAADTGEDFGGSGFLFGIETTPKPASHLYAITAAHVIHDGFTVVRINLRHDSRKQEHTESLPFTKEDWIIDPINDLAVCPLPPDFNSLKFSFSVIDKRFLMSRDDFVSNDIGPGDEVVYVGRFKQHAGRFMNMPSFRFGHISMNPSEEEPIVYELGGKEKRQPAFLVEARSRSGYSGSPVFTLNQHAINNRRAVFPMFDMRLLGIDFYHLTEDIKFSNLGYSVEYKAEVHAGMMGVVPAWYLLDLLAKSPRIAEQQKRDEEYYASFPVTQGELDTGPIPLVQHYPDEMSGRTINVVTPTEATKLEFPQRPKKVEPSSSKEENRVSEDALNKVLPQPRAESKAQLDEQQKENEK
jgi:hypothetical protein